MQKNKKQNKIFSEFLTIPPLRRTLPLLVLSIMLLALVLILPFTNPRQEKAKAGYEGALTPTSSWQSASGYLNAEDVDTWDFAVTDGHEYTVTFCEAEGGADFDTKLYAFDETHTQIAFNDDTCGSWSKITFTPTFTGTATIEVHEFSEMTGGNYTFNYIDNSVSFTHTNYGTEEDCIETDVCLTRGVSGDIYNSSTGSYQWACGACGAETTAYQPNLKDIQYDCWGGGMTNIPGNALCLELPGYTSKYDVTFSSWTSSNNGGGFVYLRTFFDAPPPPPSPEIVYVDNAIGTDDTDCGDVGDPCATIDFAMTEREDEILELVVAETGNPYTVNSYLVFENMDFTIPADAEITMNNSIYLAGSSTLNIGSGAVLSFGASKEIQVSSGANVNISGTVTDRVTLQGQGAGTWKGISLYNIAGNSTIKYADISNVNGFYIADYYAGISLVNIDNADSLVIQNCKIHDNEGAGILIYGDSGNNILKIGVGSRADNEIYGNDYGIEFTGGTLGDPQTGQVMNNYIHDNSRAGIYFNNAGAGTGYWAVEIVNNLIALNGTLTEAEYGGIVFEDSALVFYDPMIISYNTIEGSLGFGIDFDGTASTYALTVNNILSNNEVGIKAQSNEPTDILNNMFYNNGEHDYLIDLIGVNSNFVGDPNYADGPDYGLVYTNANLGDDYYLGASSDAIGAASDTYLLSDYVTDITTDPTDLLLDIDPFDIGFHYGNASYGTASATTYVDADNAGGDVPSCGATQVAACETIGFALTMAAGTPGAQTIHVLPATNPYSITTAINLTTDHLTFGDNVELQVQANITGGSGIHLTFEEGVNATFAEGVGITSTGGELDINGVSGNMVTMTGDNPGVTFWSGIKISEPSSTSTVNYLDISEAKGLCGISATWFGMVCIHSLTGTANAEIFNSYFHGNGNVGVITAGNINNNRLFIGGNGTDNYGNYFNAHGVAAEIESGEAQYGLIANNYFRGFSYYLSASDGVTQGTNNQIIVNNLFVSNAASQINLSSTPGGSELIAYNTFIFVAGGGYAVGNIGGGTANYRTYNNIVSGEFEYAFFSASDDTSTFGNNLLDADVQAPGGDALLGQLVENTHYFVGDPVFTDGPNFSYFSEANNQGDNYYLNQTTSAALEEASGTYDLTDYLASSTTDPVDRGEDTDPFDVGFHYGILDLGTASATTYVDGDNTGGDVPSCGATQVAACETIGYALSMAEFTPGFQTVYALTATDPYLINSALTLTTDHLTFDAGVNVAFGTDGKIDVGEGVSFNISGTSVNKVILTSSNPGVVEWGGIRFHNSGNSTINYAEITQGMTTCDEDGGMICIDGMTGGSAGVLKIFNSEFHDTGSNYPAINVQGNVASGKLMIGGDGTNPYGNYFHDNDSDGILAMIEPGETQYALIANNYFVHPGWGEAPITIDSNDYDPTAVNNYKIVNNFFDMRVNGGYRGIWDAVLGGPDHVIAYNTFYGSKGVIDDSGGISIANGATSNPPIYNNIFRDTDYAVACSGGDTSTVNFKGNLYYNNLNNAWLCSLPSANDIGVDDPEFTDGPDNGYTTQVNNNSDDLYLTQATSPAVGAANATYLLSSYVSGVTTDPVAQTEDTAPFDVGFHYGGAEGGGGGGPEPDESGVDTTADVGNVSPVFTVTPSDGGSDSSAPADAGTDSITFTGTAKDINGNSWYLAVCSTDAVTAGAPPTCGGGAWGVSAETASDASATATYPTVGNEACDESCSWWAFSCDSSACYPSGGISGDPGRALGTLTFSDVPADGNSITVDTLLYEFDGSAPIDCDGGVLQDVCVDTAGDQDGYEAAVSFVDDFTGLSSLAINRGPTVYLYAAVQGASGNSIDMSIGTCPNCSVSGATLTGGSDSNGSPFKINHAPAFGTVTVTNTSDEAIKPGNTMKFTLPLGQVSDSDTDGTQDSVTMYICTPETSGFDYGADTCTGGSLICSGTVADPSANPISCEGGADLISVPTAHGSYSFKVYAEDTHSFAGTGTDTQSYTVTDVPPVWTSYTTADSVSISAGGSDTITRAVTFTDDNGDRDPTALDLVFFEDTAVNDDCTSDENDCYRYDNIDLTSPPAGCTVTERSLDGTGKTATGTDSSLTVSCDFTVWFNAAASDNWEMSGTAADELGDANFDDSGVNTSVPALSGLDLVQASIPYSSVAIGGTSAGKQTTMENMGNQVLDILIQGTDMARDGGGGSIPAARQKWIQGGQGLTVNDEPTPFDWDSPETNPGPWILKTSSGIGGETDGCANRDMAVRAVHDSGASEDEAIWWKIRIPSAQSSGSYTGANTFTTTSGDTCTGTEH